MIKKGLTYSKSGVDYSLMDPLKRMAQSAGKKTSQNLSQTGFQEVNQSRGESAYVVESDDCYFALVEEGLGTKNLVADKLRSEGGKTYYDQIAHDTVAMIVNDLITVGAKPITVLAYWAVGSSDWFKDKKRMEDLVKGWAEACNLAGCTWGGGETPTLSEIIEKKTIDLAGAGFGVIKPKSRLTLGDKLNAGDAIVVFESSGIHANGLTLARTIAEKLPEGYETKLPNGPFDSAQDRQVYGRALLTPTIIYAKLINELLDQGINIHYMANITGHGWRKIMRHIGDFVYRVTQLPPVPEVLQFIQEKGLVSDKEMYGNFNMGAGYAVYVPQTDVEKVIQIAEENNIKAYKVGTVEKGERQVIIEPKEIVFEGKSLQVKV